MRVNVTQRDAAPQPDGAPETFKRTELVGKVAEAPETQTTKAGLRGKPDPRELEEAVAKINETAKVLNRSLTFVMVEDRISVKVIDAESGEVIREIPPEKLIEALSSLVETIGLLLDRKL
jgi:uncharacterized FlaG/YvyC family protein